jgi:hypothetical protein
MNVTLYAWVDADNVYTADIRDDEGDSKMRDYIIAITSVNRNDETIKL